MKNTKVCFTIILAISVISPVAFAGNNIVDFGTSVPTIDQLRSAFGHHSRTIVSAPRPSAPPSPSLPISANPPQPPAYAPAPAPATVPPVVQQQPSSAPANGISLQIQFGYDSALVSPKFQPHLASLAAYLREDASMQLKIVGHTDSIGSDDYNQALSERRAMGVFNALVQDHGVDSRRLSVEGQGKSQPRYSEDSRNRRVEFLTRN